MPEEYKYATNWEYAVKRVRPVVNNRDKVEVYDNYTKEEVDTSEWEADMVVDLIGETLWNGRPITEQEFEEIKREK